MRPERLTNGKHDNYILLFYKMTFQKKEFFFYKKAIPLSRAKKKKYI